MRSQGLIYCLFSCVVVAATSTPARADLPNIVLILADDLGYGDVGFNGQQHIRTPCLDQMAADGMVFTQFYAGSTVCMPSRCCLLTGKHTGHATIRGNPRWTRSGNPVDLKPTDVTVAEELKRAGYRTAAIGKWGMAEAKDEAMPLRQGFDYFFGYRTHGAAHHYYPANLWRNNQQIGVPGNNPPARRESYAHDLVVEESLDYIRDNARSPFFLYLAFTIPHLELTVPQDSKEPYQDLGWPRRKMPTKGHYKNDPEGNVTYAGMVSRMDRDIGRIRALLESLGIADNTLVLFTSDNGPEYEKQDRFFNSNGPLRGGKRDLYEGGIRVPMVAVWPDRIPRSTKSDHLSAFWDVLPTACDIVGQTASDSRIDGISLLPTLSGNADQQRHHKYLYWEFNEKAGPIQAIRLGKWKAVRKLRGGSGIELYDLEQEIGERNNIASDSPDVVAECRELFENARDDHPEFSLGVLGKRRNSANELVSNGPEGTTIAQ